MRFRNFIIPLTEDRHYMALYSGRSGREDEFDLPVAVTNFLNMVPPEIRPNVLTWIMTEGVRRAAVRRRRIAHDVSKHLSKLEGRPVNIPQDAVFSQVAYKQIPALGKLASEIEKQWHDQEGEPKYIRVADRNSEGQRLVNIAQINAHLAQAGRQPLYFGGPDGLMEYLERGDWVEGQKHINSRFGKQGHDLSLPPGDDGLYIDKEIDPKTGKLKKNVLYKLGLGENGYKPPTDSHYWKTRIQQAQHNSNLLLTQIQDDIKNGRPFDNKELDYIHQLMKNGQIKGDSRSAIQADVLGIKRAITEPIKAAGGPEEWLYAKAAMKACVEKLLASHPPKTETGYGRSSAMGNLPDAGLPPAKIIVDGYGGKKAYQLSPSDNTDDPMVRSQLADKITNLIFDDETGEVGTSIRVLRGSRNNQVRQDVRQLLSHAPDSAASRGIADKLQDGQPFTVTMNGKPVSINPTDLVKRREESEQKFHHVPNKVVDTGAPMDTKKISPHELDGYTPMGTRGNVTLYGMPGSNIRRKIVKTPHGLEEYKPPEPQIIDIAHEEQRGFKPEFFGKNYVKLTNANGQTRLAHRVHSPTGEKWIEVPGTTDIDDTEHLVSPIKARVNTGAGFIPSMKFSPEETDEKFKYFMSHPEEFGENAPKEGIPSSVWHAINSLSDLPKGIKIDHANAGAAALANNVGAVGFHYGDLDTGRGETELKSLLADQKLSPEEINQIFPVIQKVLGNGGFAQHFPPPGPLFKEPNMFRDDVYEALLKNGYYWRQRKAASAIRMSINQSGETKNRAIGQGGSGGNDDETDWTKVVAAGGNDDDANDFEPGTFDDDLFSYYNDEDFGRESGQESDDDQYKDFSQGSLEDLEGGNTPDTPGGPAVSQPGGPRQHRNISTARAFKDLSYVDRPFMFGPSSPTPGGPAPVAAKPRAHNPMLAALAKKVTPSGPAVTQPKKPPIDLHSLARRPNESFKSFGRWLVEQGGNVVFDPRVKPKDGCGFNYWGAPGTTGVSITGRPDTAKSDPTGKKDKGGRRKEK